MSSWPTSASFPLYESPFLERSLASLPSEARSLVRRFAERGYVVVDLEHDGFDGLAERLIAALDGRYSESDHRIDEAWYFCPEVRALASASKVLDTIRLLYGCEAFPFQTLNFDRGTEQAAHSDTIHFHSIPRHFMCGVWVALEDVDLENGPLFVLPGSHRMQDIEMFDLGLRPTWEDYALYEERTAAILEARGYAPEALEMRKGQAVIWAANLFHGGLPIRDPSRTRHSQATHYYFDDCVYYYPMGTDPFGGRITLREAIDVAAGRLVPHRFRGGAVRLADYPHVWTYERPLPDWVENDGPVDDFPEDPAVELDRLRLRAHALEETVGHLRENLRRIDAERALVQEDNRRKDAFIRARDGELAYRIARRVTKTVRALTGRRGT